MVWLINDKHSPTRIVESSELLELKDYIQNNGIICNVTVQHCNPMFFVSSEGATGVSGPTGATGAIGARGIINDSDDRDIADDSKLFVDIEFTMSIKNAEAIKNHKLILTPNKVGKYLPTWNISKCNKSIPYLAGIYKKEGFDNAFNALRKLKPNLTEKDFAYTKNYDGYGWDLDLVEYNLFEGKTDKLLDTIISYETVETGVSIVRLSLLICDIKNNFDYIKSILSVYK